MRRVPFIVHLLLLVVAVSAQAFALPLPVQAMPDQAMPDQAKPTGRPATVNSRAVKPASALTVVNINTASSAQLEALPGVGPRTAQAIIEHRQKNGAFKKIEELMNVKGIGEKSFLKLKPMVSVAADKGDRPGDSR